MDKYVIITLEMARRLGLPTNGGYVIDDPLSWLNRRMFEEQLQMIAADIDSYNAGKFQGRTEAYKRLFDMLAGMREIADDMRA